MVSVFPLANLLILVPEHADLTCVSSLPKALKWLPLWRAWKKNKRAAQSHLWWLRSPPASSAKPLTRQLEKNHICLFVGLSLVTFFQVCSRTFCQNIFTLRNVTLRNVNGESTNSAFVSMSMFPILMRDEMKRCFLQDVLGRLQAQRQTFWRYPKRSQPKLTEMRAQPQTPWIVNFPT